MGIYTFSELGVKYKLSQEAIREFRKFSAVNQAIGILIGVLATFAFVLWW